MTYMPLLMIRNLCQISDKQTPIDIESQTKEHPVRAWQKIEGVMYHPNR